MILLTKIPIYVFINLFFAFLIFDSTSKFQQIFHKLTNIEINNNKGTIYFHNVQESDYKENRYYACAAYNSELMEYKFSNRFNFDIKKTKRNKLNTVIPASEQYVNQSSPIALVGKIHKLSCFFSGYPDPFPTWYHNGVQITPNNTKNFKFESFGKTLVFNVTMNHMGKYECKFQTHTSAIDRVFNVKVEAAPYWHDLPPANTNTSEGETVVFDCKTSGNPTPVVTFYKNGVEMKKPKQGENWIIDNYRLTIYDVKKGLHGEGDNAVYQCKSKNKHGYLWTNFYLNLLAHEPKLLEKTDIIETIEGKSVTMFCKFFASPIANVTWVNPLLNDIEHQTNVDQFGVGWLIFPGYFNQSCYKKKACFFLEVHFNYEGEYKCIGRNKYGIDSGNIKLLIRKPTKLKLFEKKNIKHQAGLPLSLECNATHDKNLNVFYQWFANDKLIDINSHLHNLNANDDIDHFQLLINNTLLIKNPTQHDSGEYACVASTKLDSVKKSIFISIEDVPIPVYSAFISRCDSQGNTATIHFEHLEPATSSVPVKEFWVRYVSDPDEDSTCWKTHPASIRAIDYEAIYNLERRVKASITIPLYPFGTYTFQIIARNSIGDSSPQQVKGECITDQKAPTRNPNGVYVEGSQPDNLIIYWNAMSREEWNGEKFAYQIFYRPVDNSNTDWKSIEVDDPFAEKLTIDLKDSQPWKLFEVQVRAKNIFGNSLVTPEIVEGRTGEGDPGVTPNNFKVANITASSAQFYWNSIDSNKVQGNFTGYKIIYWNDDTDEEEIDYNIKEQRLKRRHIFSLNKIYLLKSKKLFKRIINTTVRNRRTATLNTFSELNRKSIIVVPSASSTTIYNLKPNSINYATISVTNGQNEGLPSDVLSFRTREGVPTKVQNLKVYVLNNKNKMEKGVVVLRWDLPQSLNGRLTHFGLKKCLTQEIDKKLIYCEEEQKILRDIRELRVTNLEYNSTYRFKIYACTNAGAGLPNSVDFKTLPEIENLDVAANLSQPDLKITEIKKNSITITYLPGKFDDIKQSPVGNTYYVKYRKNDNDNWQFKHPKNDKLDIEIDKLDPGTKYQIATVSVFQNNNKNLTKSESNIHEVMTAGVSQTHVTIMYTFIGMLLILLLILFCCCIYCLLRQRGQKYLVAEKERLHGREPILPKDRAFDEYGKFNEDEKKSLTGHSKTNESETDSMAEFGDCDQGRFTEDGSFIGQYGPNKTLIATTKSIDTTVK